MFQGVIDKLSQPVTLWLAFLGTVLCTLAFSFIGEHYGITFLDSLSDPDQSRALMAGMSAEQRSVHAWVTATLDVLYPAVYGALFAGSALCFFAPWPRWARLLALPVVVLVVVDLLEGGVQILGLTGVVDWLGAKAVLTSTKMLLVIYGLALTVLGWLLWLARRVTSLGESER